MKRKILGLSLILCVAVALCFASVFASHGAAKAENVDVLVSLSDDSLLTAYGDCFAYTDAKSVYLAKDNKLLSFTESVEFDGFIDIAMNSTHILALAKKGEQKYLWAYEYNDMRIAKLTNYTPTDLFLNYVVGIYANQDGAFFAMETNKVNLISLDPNVSNSAYFNSNTDFINGQYSEVTDFVVEDDTLYCIIDGDLYVIDAQSFNYPDLSTFYKIGGDFIDICAVDGNILLMSATGVYGYDNTDTPSPLMSDGINAYSKIASAYDSKNDVNYVYTKSNLNAINMYVYASGELEYYGCFDNTVYTHPTTYDIVKLYKAGADTTLYSSPRHLQRMGIISTDKYFIVLNEEDEYLYVYYFDAQENKTQYGYIKKNADIILCPASEQCPFGSFLQPLHSNTSIYRYPFVGSGSEKLLDAPITMQLVFIDNVGQDGAYSWGWYKVGFVDSNGNTQYGYVRTVDVSPYTELIAPSLSKSVKLTSKKLGQYITLYALPFENEEDAIEVVQLAEGTTVYLREKYDRKSQWTAVYYEGKTAYVRTANVKASGLTPWQIALAVTIPCVVIAIGVAVTLIILAKKKKRVFNYY